MGFEGFGDQIMVPITITLLHIIVAEIREWLPVPDIQIIEIMLYSIGVITVATEEKTSKGAILNSPFRNSTWWRITTNLDQRPNREKYPIG